MFLEGIEREHFITWVNSFLPNLPILHPLKTENQNFLMFLRGLNRKIDIKLIKVHRLETSQWICITNRVTSFIAGKIYFS